MKPSGSQLLRLPRAILLNPTAMHIPLEDGGHLLAIPIRSVPNREALTPEELIEVDYLSIIAALILKKFAQAEWINYQENGNWGLDKPNTQHMHLHIYGRKRNSLTQAWGEALRFPDKAEKHKVSFPPFQSPDLEAIISWIHEFRKSNIAARFEKIIKLNNPTKASA